ncbi:hypothetical protein FUA23_00945 [Neolewinella aurantiaca]|uniref:Acetyltransferase (GNAT) family protein n=1 Tax=Neolewinella aurantiaca TaxID=2602767 RepID=A0A5C7G0M3_9BACT|nr:hypothetical protein [Neolewinella aurantiaca]TXF91783.1 hypothetical protein FUA23_00945 [Neolewinella aurantiaca]
MKPTLVKLLSRNDLNLQRWDRAVRSAPYGLSWWLDAVTNQRWSGLVLDDYRAVMPLPHRNSIGPFKLINGAPFTQHQGVFGDLQAGDLDLLLNAIPKYYHVRKLAIYPPWPATRVLKNWVSTPRTNHELDLNPPYPIIARGYRRDLRRKLRDSPVTTLAEWPIAEFLSFFQEHTGTKANLSRTDYSALKQLTRHIITQKTGQCYHLTDDEGKTIAALVLVHHGNRIFNLLAASSHAGFGLHGMPRLLDGIIRAYAGTDTILDFEGSDLPGVALFFQGFGAKPIEYLRISRS